MIHNFNPASLHGFLSFANTNLEGKSFNRFKLAADLKDALDYQRGGSSFSDPINYQCIEELLKASDNSWKNLQERLRKFFDMFEEQFKEFEAKRKNGITTSEYSKISLLEPVPMQITFTLSIEPGDSPDEIESSDPAQNGLLIWEAEDLVGTRLVLRATGESIQDTIIYFFFQAVGDLPLSALKRCPECRGWFVQTSVRERVYCSSRCATKKGNKDRYQDKKKKKESPQTTLGSTENTNVL